MLVTGLSRLVNFDRHPLNMSSYTGFCRRILNRQGFLLLPGFINEVVLGAFETEAQGNRENNITLGFPIPANSLARQLFWNDQFKTFLSSAVSATDLQLEAYFSGIHYCHADKSGLVESCFSASGFSICLMIRESASGAQLDIAEKAMDKTIQDHSSVISDNEFHHEPQIRQLKMFAGTLFLRNNYQVSCQFTQIQDDADCIFLTRPIKS